jgi:hypothetical protein
VPTRALKGRVKQDLPSALITALRRVRLRGGSVWT